MMRGGSVPAGGADAPGSAAPVRRGQREVPATAGGSPSTTAGRELRGGTVIGSYRIDELIARGGMSVVYRATDRRLARRVALKVLATGAGRASAEMRERFLREARFASAIDHPHIVPIYDAGEVDDLLYIAMRWVRGTTLEDLLDQRGVLSADDTVAVLRPIADALDVAHAADLLHRDVKPSNILLSGGPDGDGPGHVYLTDFGVSRSVSAGTKLTADGNVIGTASYMAPEQIAGRQLDARADLYGLGCVGYECLTGTPPFVRDDQAALLWAHINDRPAAVSTHRPQLRTLDRVLSRALAKDPADRYRTCSQFVAALAASMVQDPPAGTSRATVTVGGPAGTGAPSASAAGSAPLRPARPPGSAVRVFLVDDHELVRKGVADVLDATGDLTVVGEASSVAQALAEIPVTRPDVAVLDMRLPDGNGIELCRELRSVLPELQCLMLTALDDEQAMLTAILAGAGGYAIKDISGSDLVTAVRTVGAGRPLTDSRTMQALIGRLRDDSRPAGRLAALTPRERSVLSLVADGLTNKDIAQQMSLSESTVKNHVSRLMDKLGVSRRGQAAEILRRQRDSGEHPAP